MRLLMSNTSPYARKCRILARELGLAVEDVAIDTMKDPAELLAANPLGKIPVLLTDEGAVYDSPVICARLFDMAPGQGLMPAEGAARRAMQVTEALADGILDAALGLRAELLSRPADPTWTGRMTRAIERGLPALGARLTGGFDFGAVCALSVIHYLDFRFPVAEWPTLDWRRVEALAALDAMFGERASVRETMPGA